MNPKTVNNEVATNEGLLLDNRSIFGFTLEARLIREHLYTMKDMVVMVMTVLLHRSLPFQKVDGPR